MPNYAARLPQLTPAGASSTGFDPMAGMKDLATLAMQKRRLNLAEAEAVRSAKLFEQQIKNSKLDEKAKELQIFGKQLDILASAKNPEQMELLKESLGADFDYKWEDPRKSKITLGDGTEIEASPTLFKTLGQKAQGISDPKEFQALMTGLVTQGSVNIKQPKSLERMSEEAKTKRKETDPRTTFEKLLDRYYSLEPGDPKRKWIGQKLEKEATKTGRSIRITPEGEIEILEGAIGDMTKKTKGDIEGKLISTSERVARLNKTATMAKDKYLEIPTRFKAMKAEWGEKTTLWKPSEEDKQLLGDFSKFKRTSVEDLNLLIKDLAGAAVSKAEEKRMVASVPNPGKGLFDGDSPTEFNSKLDDTLHSTRMAIARYIRLLKSDISPESAYSLIESGQAKRLTEIESEINEYANNKFMEIKKQNPDMPNININKMVKDSIKEEYFVYKGLTW